MASTTTDTPRVGAPASALWYELDHLSRIWALELQGSGERVLSLDPGDMDTPLHAAAAPGADPAGL